MNLKLLKKLIIIFLICMMLLQGTTSSKKTNEHDDNQVQEYTTLYDNRDWDDYPNIVDLFRIGITCNDWNIWCLEISDNVPDLECVGSLRWTNVKPGSTVSSSFKVKNTGDEGSLLDWEIIERPEWGNWSFSPNSGTDLPSGASITVTVSVVAPSEENGIYTGKVVVFNSEDTNDYCEIDVYLQTPKSKALHNSLLLNFFERFPKVFPILQKLLYFLR